MQTSPIKQQDHTLKTPKRQTKGDAQSDFTGKKGHFETDHDVHTAGQVAEDFTSVALSSHLIRLRTCKKLLAAVYIAAGIDDEQLVCKAALRAHHLLLPLLQLRRTPAFLFQVYAVIHSAIRVFLRRGGAGEGGADAGHGDSAQALRGVHHPQVRRVLCCISRAAVSCAQILEEPKLLQAVLNAEFDDQEAALAQFARETDAGIVFEGASPEQVAMWEFLLKLPDLQERAKQYDGKLKGVATEVRIG
jgi:hypothetical protein